jgi:hypothetical protein
MHCFLGICRTLEIICSTYLDNRGTYSWRSTSPRRIPTTSPAKALRPTAGSRGTTAKVPKPVAPAAEREPIDRILISLANDHPVSLVKSDLDQLFKFSQFQLGSLTGQRHACRGLSVRYDYHIISIKSRPINCAMQMIPIDRIARRRRAWPWRARWRVVPSRSTPNAERCRHVSRQSDTVGNFGSITQTAAKS